MPISYLARFTCRVCSTVEVVPVEKVYTKPFDPSATVQPTPPLGWTYDCCPNCIEAEKAKSRAYLEKLFALEDDLTQSKK